MHEHISNNLYRIKKIRIDIVQTQMAYQPSIRKLRKNYLNSPNQKVDQKEIFCHGRHTPKSAISVRSKHIAKIVNFFQ